MVAYLTTQGVKPFTSVLKPRREVLEGRIEEALNLANIYLYNELRGKHPEADYLEETPLYKPEEFLKRTYVSKEMKNILLVVMGGLARASYVYLDDKGRRIPVSKRVIVIPSALGGGKTHLLTTLYYVAKLCNEKSDVVANFFEDRELAYGLKRICGIIREQGRINTVVIAGDTHALAPTPDNPVTLGGLKIYTPWGLLGYLLGEYEKIRKADEEHYQPGVDELRSALRGKTTLILIDEAVEYMVKAIRLDTKYQGYSEAFLSFIRNLAMAVDETPGAVLVITLPAEFREGGIGKSFQHPEYVERINSMLSRVGPEYHPPLVFERDICEVFKKRLFENASSSEVQESAKLVVNTVREKALRDSTLRDSIKVKYGDVSDYLNKLRDTYPFSPYFVELLVNIALKTPELGLTRYLISFVARLVKYAYDYRTRFNRDPHLALITPWIIPIDVTEFRYQLLRGMLSQIQSDFQRIYEQDVKKYSERLEQFIYADQKPGGYEFLRAILTRTIWLATIPGRGGKSSDVIGLYPRVDELPVIVHDPISVENIPLADVINTVKDLENVSTYLSRTHDNRVFYALIPDIMAILRQKYLTLTDYEALRMLETLVSRGSFRPGKMIKIIQPIYLSREKEIEEFAETYITKTSEPMLIIYLGLENPPRSIADHVLKRNNVVLLLPDLDTSPHELGLHYTERIKRILASEPPTVKEYIKNLLKLLKAIEDLKLEREYLKEAVGEEHLDYVNRVLSDIKREVEKQLFVSIYSALRKAIIGVQKKTYEVDLRPFEEEVKDLSILCKQLEESLRKYGVITEWTWSDIVNQFKDWTNIWDIDQSPKQPIRVGDIWYQLLYSHNIKPHLTSMEEFKKALENAYLGNIIAFKHGSEVLWLKHPYSQSEALKLLREKVKEGRRLHDWERDIAGELEKLDIKLLDLEIISPRYVVKDYVRKLLEKTEVKPGEKIIRRLVVYTPDGEKEFETFLAMFKSERDLVEALSKYPVVLLEEKPQREFKLTVLRACGKPFAKGTPIELEDVNEIKVYGVLESEDLFEVKVLLDVRDIEDKPYGKPVEEVVKTPGTFELKTLITQPGEYNVFLRAEESSGYRQVLHVARVRIKGEKCEEFYKPPLELKQVIESIQPDLRVNIELVEVQGSAGRSIAQSLSDLLVELGRHGARVSGFIKASAREGKEAGIKVEFESISSTVVSRIIQVVSAEVGNIEVDLRLHDVSTSVLKASRLLFDPYQPLQGLVRFKVKECRRI